MCFHSQGQWRGRPPKRANLPPFSNPGRESPCALFTQVAFLFGGTGAGMATGHAIRSQRGWSDSAAIVACGAHFRPLIPQWAASGSAKRHRRGGAREPRSPLETFRDPPGAGTRGDPGHRRRLPPWRGRTRYPDEPGQLSLCCAGPENRVLRGARLSRCRRYLCCRFGAQAQVLMSGLGLAPADASGTSRSWICSRLRGKPRIRRCFASPL
jgi:hypothetical protein